MIIDKYIKSIRLVVLVAAIAAAGISINRCSEEQDRAESLTGNVIHYQDLYNNSIADKVALEMQSYALKHTNDILVRKMDSIARASKINIKKPGSMASSISTTINTIDTVPLQNTDTTAIKNCNFKVSLRPNDETRYDIELKNDTLIHEALINNTQYLFVYPKKEYLNNYKTFIGRLIRLDFKKIDLTKYHIENTNNLIKTKETKVFVVK